MTSKHPLNVNFVCIFFMNYVWAWEDLLKKVRIMVDELALQWWEGRREGKKAPRLGYEGVVQKPPSSPFETFQHCYVFIVKEDSQFGGFEVTITDVQN